MGLERHYIKYPIQRIIENDLSNVRLNIKYANNDVSLQPALKVASASEVKEEAPPFLIEHKGNML